jgi:nitrite reductase (NO-forming)
MDGMRTLSRGTLAVLVSIPLLLGIVGGGAVTLWLGDQVSPPSGSGSDLSFELRALTTGFVGVGGLIDGVKNPRLETGVGDTVTITITNGENIMHNLVVEGYGVQSADVHTLNEVASLSFVADQEGTFRYYCAYHISTMIGDLVVGAGSEDGPSNAQPVDVDDIARSPTDLPPPTMRSAPATVDIYLEAKEVVAEIEAGTTFTYWTFNGKVPGPFFRVRVGDTVIVHFRNNESNTMMHSVDFHAVTGPGGGMAATESMPGEETGFSFKALVPGLFVYHCASAHIPSHISMGMYGLILVEPEGGLPAVDHEFYVMQGDIYTKWPAGTKGHQEFDAARLLDENPTYVVFNGRFAALTGGHTLNATVNDTLRIYFGVGGPNLISSFHVIGEIFDYVYNLGDLMSAPLQGVQTVLVPPGGAVVVDFAVQVPGNYLLVDHSLVRTIDKGSVGILRVDGPSDPTIFNP